ncbi:protein-disulfide reductase DsbD [Salinicola sp. DM10]|uniref:protein-disulfide reductase DsbD n=1 Tax=Salinicola sp. DM10 TaxID=2815721 RepID=UPI001A8E0057|nr:protein-disulfide reductase DsbD [Salinicola sp. DM10]MCE3027476.1 protein-disulfide reductase DsbD [Salinicola sp. DM10]
MSFSSRCLLIITLCLLTSLAQAQSPFSSPRDTSPFASAETAEFLPVTEAFHAYAWHDAERVYVGLRARPGHYLYRQRFALADANGEALTPLTIPPGTFKQDPYLGPVHIFRDTVVLSAPLPRSADRASDTPLALTLSFQGCADAGLCYPPEHWRLTARAGGAPAAFTDASDDAQASPLAANGDRDADPRALFAAPSRADSSPLSDSLPQADPLPQANARPQADPFSDQTPGSDIAPSGQPTNHTASNQPAAEPGGSAKDIGDGALPLSADARFQTLLGQGLGLGTLALFFLAGVGLTFTPCVLPMLPILTAIIVGQNASRRRALGLSLSYVAGMAATFTLLGTLMGLFGASLNLQARLQSAWVLVPLALLFAAFAAALFGAFELRLPSRLRQGADAWQQRLQRSGPLGLAAAGALSVLVVSPCVSAPLAGALVFISTTGDVLGGALALLALGLGMGLPLVVAGTFGARLLPRAGAWMNGVKALFGVLLLSLAIWLLARLLPGPVTLLLWALLALACALALGALDLRTPPGWPRLRQAAGWLLLVWGVALAWGAAQGGGDPLRPLASGAGSPTPGSSAAAQFTTVTNNAQLQAALDAAQRDGRPVMLDVSADWCIACQVMEHQVFPAPAVAERLAGFTLIRADVSADSAASRALLSHYGLFGPPALLFFDGGGERRAARIQGEIDAVALAAHLDALLSSRAQG